MTKLIVDPATRMKLAEARNALELCDDDGHVLGHFIPIASGSQRSSTEPLVSNDELDRREREGGGRSLREILAELEKKA